ncbi:uncharacterized protein LOC112351418 [Selaginella moellendorffii]|uniref:uncharacterized protein LOC112351418 n=1 Tax=Selaginella moellendorffii TaxID=88036 RepID=UPI000D1CE244|nr:uncharacterized protein LOC112351418 [Selaginella moellendorffii]|eukprot:XP_024545079.1 uncharacterized protein LOC112351418 [Selaginella moellendorffii]
MPAWDSCMLESAPRRARRSLRSHSILDRQLSSSSAQCSVRLEAVCTVLRTQPSTLSDSNASDRLLEWYVIADLFVLDLTPPWWQGLVTSANLESSLLIPTELFLAPTESEGKAVEIRSYIDRVKELRYYLHTVVVVDVTFGVKELKVSEADMQLFFDKAGSPILLAPKFSVDDAANADFDANERSAQQLFGKYLSNWIAADTNEESNVDGFCAQATSPGMKRGCWYVLVNPLSAVTIQ